MSSGYFEDFSAEEIERLRRALVEDLRMFGVGNSDVFLNTSAHVLVLLGLEDPALRQVLLDKLARALPGLAYARVVSPGQLVVDRAAVETAFALGGIMAVEELLELRPGQADA